MCDPPKNTGTGHRPMTRFWFFVKIPSVTMTDSETEDDGWEPGSRDEEQSEEGGDDDVEEVEASGSRVSVKPILLMKRSLSVPRTNSSPKTWKEYGNTKNSCGQKWSKMIPLLLWTTGCGTTSKLTDGITLPESSHREASIRPSTNGYS
jgi:hypothetical protein